LNDRRFSPRPTAFVHDWFTVSGGRQVADSKAENKTAYGSVRWSGALDGGDVHEDIPASTCGLNETIALLRIEPLHRDARHCRILQVSDLQLIAPGKPILACELGGLSGS
jgi:hypothetical protein